MSEFGHQVSIPERLGGEYHGRTAFWKMCGWRLGNSQHTDLIENIRFFPWVARNRLVGRYARPAGDKGSELFILKAPRRQAFRLCLVFGRNQHAVVKQEQLG